MLVGIDEAGRGCWAGPLVAAAVLLDKPIVGLADSKQLSKRKRAELDATIRQDAKAFGIGWVTPQEVDELGLTAATSLAMRRAIDQIDQPYDEVVIDGNLNYLPAIKSAKTLIKADALIPAVSAASILAKVARDNYMAGAAVEFPQYEFDKHVGYGTALHLSKLKLHGPCELHRLSYRPLKNLLIVNR
jgi:ribonuclease HII